jgi:hypothetical protein
MEEAMRLTFFKGVGLGAAVSALTLTATAALAGTGIGGVFNLGAKNSVNASTQLTGRVAGPSLQVTNTSTKTKATGLDIRVTTGKPPLVVNSATEVPHLNAGLLDGKPASAFLPVAGTAANSSALGGIAANGFIKGTGQAAGGRATEADNGSQGMMLSFTNWDLRGTCYTSGGRTDLVTHSFFEGTLNVAWWGPRGVTTTTVAGGGHRHARQPGRRSLPPRATRAASPAVRRAAGAAGA